MAITLSAATRDTLFAIQRSTGTMAKTINNLQSGKKVNSAIDDAVLYFQAKGLNDRARQFSVLKDNMVQHIQLITAATNGLNAAKSIYKQMNGLVESAKTADTQTKLMLSAQWKDLLGQLGSMATDSSYSDDNLLMPDPNPYPATFDANTYWSHPKDVGRPPINMQTSLAGSGMDVAIGALPIYDVVSNTLPAGATPITNPGNGHQYIHINTPSTWTDAKTNADTMVLNGMQGYLATVTSAAENTFINTNYTNLRSWIGASDAEQEGQWTWVDGPEYGTLFSSGNLPSTPVAGQYANWAGGEPNNALDDENYAVMNWFGPQWNDLSNSGGGLGPCGYVVEFSPDYPAGMPTSGDPTLVSVANYLDAPINFPKTENWCNKALSYVNAVMSNYGNAITTLQSFNDFAGSIANTINDGSDKMTLADLNGEGANLLAMQTRQQIGQNLLGSISKAATNNILTLMAQR